MIAEEVVVVYLLKFPSTNLPRPHTTAGSRRGSPRHEHFGDNIIND